MKMSMVLTSLLIGGLLGVAARSSIAGEAAWIPPRPEASVEANQVTLSLNRGKGGGGTLSAVGCTGCPLYFELDSTTLFTLNGEPISLVEASVLSGTAGAVIFDRDTRHLRRVLW